MTTTTQPAVPSAEDRENALVLLAYDPDEYGRLHEKIGDDALAFILHSISVEILRLRTAADTLVYVGGSSRSASCLVRLRRWRRTGRRGGR